MTEPSACRQCSADTELKHLDRVEGESSGVRITVQDVPVVACAHSHRRLPTPDYPERLMKAIITSDQLPPAAPAVKKGLFKKHLHCPDCGAELPEEAGEKESATGRLDVGNGESLPFQMQLPVFRCSGCSTRVTLSPDGLQRGVMQAMANALRSADIQPG
jgi:hypothetical protein